MSPYRLLELRHAPQNDPDATQNIPNVLRGIARAVPDTLGHQ